MTQVDLFDPARLRLPDHRQSVLSPTTKTRTPRHKPGELFLKGPIPWDWLARAAVLPGKALSVALVVWHLAGLCKSHTIQLKPSKVRSMGMSPRVGRRGLKALEDAGLVSVDRHRGRSPDVTILDASTQNSETER